MRLSKMEDVSPQRIALETGFESLLEANHWSCDSQGEEVCGRKENNFR